MSAFRHSPRFHDVMETLPPTVRPGWETAAQLMEQRDQWEEAWLAQMPGFAETSYTPTATGSVITLGGGGASTARYTPSGAKRIRWNYNMTLGTVASLAGGPLALSLPSGITSAAWRQNGVAWAFDSSGAAYAVGVCEVAASATTVTFRLVKNAGGIVGVGGTDPFTWADGDGLNADIDLFIA